MSCGMPPTPFSVLVSNQALDGPEAIHDAWHLVTSDRGIMSMLPAEYAAAVQRIQYAAALHGVELCPIP